VQPGNGLKTSVDSRAILTALMTACFVCSHNLFIYCINNRHIEDTGKIVWRNTELLVFVAPLLLMGNSSTKSKPEIAFRNIAYVFLSIISGLVIVNEFGLISRPSLQIYYLNAITFVYTLYALFRADQNGNI